MELSFENIAFSPLFLSFNGAGVTIQSETSAATDMSCPTSSCFRVGGEWEGLVVMCANWNQSVNLMSQRSMPAEMLEMVKSLKKENKDILLKLSKLEEQIIQLCKS